MYQQIPAGGFYIISREQVNTHLPRMSPLQLLYVHLKKNKHYIAITIDQVAMQFPCMNKIKDWTTLAHYKCVIFKITDI
jgi:hypothetical protein